MNLAKSALSMTLAIALGAAGCSDDGGGTTPEPTPDVAGEADQSTEVTEQDQGPSPDVPVVDTPQPDVPGEGCQVWIVEVDYDESGPGAHEMIELAFSGQTVGRKLNECGVTRIAPLTSRADTCDGQVWEGALLPAEAIPVSKRWVIGTAAVQGANQVIDTEDLVQDAAASLIVLFDAADEPVRTYAYGNCKPGAGCAAIVEELDVCIPPDDVPGTGVSACGEDPLDSGFVAGRPLTPGVGNDCESCEVDCSGLGGQCRTASCVGGECVFDDAADGASCDDGAICTEGDSCQAGECVGTPLACPSEDPCLADGVCNPASGQCVYSSACHSQATCGASGCECGPGYAGDGTSCEDVDECESGAASCDALASCQNTPGGYECVCPPGYTGDGTTCEPSDCDCWWEDVCFPQSAQLEIVTLDIWAQTLAPATEPIVWVTGGSGVDVIFDFDTTTTTAPLCGSGTFDVWVDAWHHHPFNATLSYDDTANTMSVSLDEGTEAAAYVTSRNGPEGPILTLWTGMVHRWFAPTGRPARHGNDVWLLRDGEEGWGEVAIDIMLAEELITASTWWWTSEIELLRDPADHIYLSPSERWANTAMGLLEDSAADKKVLVGQFVGQDGLISGVTVDDELEAKGADPADGFDFMGQANPAAGQFEVVPPEVDFAQRVTAAWPDADEGLPLAHLPLPPYLPTIDVDAAELPLGLGVFDVPIASWHQKFLTMDQKVAFIGGMNIKTTDWDTSDHVVFQPLRAAFDDSPATRLAIADKEELPEFGPRKDYMMRIEGPSAADAVDVFHQRWQYQLDQEVEYSAMSSPFAKAPVPAPLPGGLQVQVVSTMPAPFDENHILDTLLRAVSNAQTYIFIEDQYFRAPILYDAIVQRMIAVPDLQLIVVTNSVSEWTDPGCWQTHIANEMFATLFPERYRTYRLRAFDYVRTDCVLCIDETDAHFVDMDLHSKLVIIDDLYLQTGSCNSNNRGLLYEGELATVVFDQAWVSAERDDIFANMIGPGYTPGTPAWQLINVLDAAAWANQDVYDKWDDEGMDLDLDGDPLPDGFEPSGMVYPLWFNAPDECLIEGVGGDVT